VVPSGVTMQVSVVRRPGLMMPQPPPLMTTLTPTLTLAWLSTRVGDCCCGDCRSVDTTAAL
jgi:hypothetical protein